jgi:hypothetical protein
MVADVNRTRPGERVAKRRRCKTSIGAGHKIKRDETVKWFKNRFEVRKPNIKHSSPILMNIIRALSDKSSSTFTSMGYGVYGVALATLAVLY